MMFSWGRDVEAGGQGLRPRCGGRRGRSGRCVVLQLHGVRSWRGTGPSLRAIGHFSPEQLKCSHGENGQGVVATLPRRQQVLTHVFWARPWVRTPDVFVRAESSVSMSRTSEPVGQAVPGRPCSRLRGPRAPWRPAREARPTDGPGGGSGGHQRCSEGVWERPELGGLYLMMLNWGSPAFPTCLPRGTPSALGLELLP